MNNKGFTLVELLATIVILGTIMGIATYGVIGAINKSKDKSEDIFVASLEEAIADYVNFYGGRQAKNFGDESGKKFYKCNKVNSSDSCETEEPNTEYIELTSRNVLNIVTDVDYIYSRLNEKDLINPKNKKACFDSSINPEIKIYVDRDYVYYYYVDMEGKNICDLNENNYIITNIPENLCSAINYGADDSTRLGCDK